MNTRAHDRNITRMITKTILLFKRRIMFSSTMIKLLREGVNTAERASNLLALPARGEPAAKPVLPNPNATQQPGVKRARKRSMVCGVK